MLGVMTVKDIQRIAADVADSWDDVRWVETLSLIHISDPTRRS